MTIRPDDIAGEDRPGGAGDLAGPQGLGALSPVDAGGVPAEEGISTADAADRIDEDPQAQPNLTDVEDSPTGHS